ncbi:DUF1983 domain-containing protein [Pseudomonas sp. GL-RE-29]|uniref:phage tail tip fiber protein n=1 Tax=Pseudomonas sp. GL-RE-29 TaxID=2832375 RepID=UPI001CC0FB57|nr:DUF1983 domain-containing protein [Pseudomonas sp. GL-RE-29]
MQSSDYVPGVSGWKLENGVLELAGPWGNIQIADLDKAPEPEVTPPKPFVIIDGVTYIRDSEVERGSITNAKIGDSWSIKMDVRNGHYFAAGIGVGIDSQFLVSADKYAIKKSPAFDCGAALVSEVETRALADKFLRERIEALAAVIDSQRERIDGLALALVAAKGAADASVARGR